MPRRRQVDDFKPSAKMILEAVLLLKHLKEVNLPLKDLLLTLFLGLDREDELAISRRYMSTQRGWPSTLNILMAIKKAVQKKEYGRKGWNKWILSEALKIVAKESSRRRLDVLSDTNCVNEISHKFFDVSRTADRYTALKNATGFLWHLMRGSIAKSRGLVFEDEDSYLSDLDAVGDCVKDLPKETCEQTQNPEPPSACLDNESSSDSVRSNWSKSTDSGKEKEVEVLPPETGVVSDGASEGSDWGDEEEGVVYVDAIDRKEGWKNRANTVANTLCSMFSFVCNRRLNGLQLENSLVLMAAGASERVTNYLHYLGLTASRRTALRMAVRLTSVSMKILRDRMSRDYLLRPFLTIDNFDIMERIHYSRLDAASRMFHGTWGYFHFISDVLLMKVDPEDLTLDSFVSSMRQSEKTHVEAKFFAPTDNDLIHWHAVTTLWKSN